MATLTSQTINRIVYLPVLSADGLTVTDMAFMEIIDWVDGQGKVQFTLQKIVTLWSALSALQKVNFQAIHDVCITLL